MPSLPKSDIQSERFYLPSTKGLPEDQQAYVDMNVAPLLVRDSAAIDEAPNMVTANIHLLAHRILGWNFTNEKGEVEPIDPETVGHLTNDDYNYLMTVIANIKDPEVPSAAGKPLSSTTSAPENPQ